jgi:hypothetical protein
MKLFNEFALAACLLIKFFNMSLGFCVEEFKLNNNTYEQSKLIETIYTHQFPLSCSNKEAFIIKGFQLTGLGVIITSQLSAVLTDCMHKNIVLIIDDNIPNPYFTACSKNEVDQSITILCA